MSDEIHYIVVSAPGPTDGADTVIATVPPEIVEFLNLVPGALVAGGPIPGWLTRLGVQMAKVVNCVFARGDFVFTTDPDVVREWGICPEHADCEDCQAGVETAVKALEADPDTLLVVGRLEWALMPREGNE